MTGARGSLVEAQLPGARVGAGVTIAATPPLDGRICGLDAGRVLIAAHGAVSGIGYGTLVWGNAGAQRMALGTCALGRAIDACGRPLDGGPPLRGGRAALDLAPL
ncbi:MAG TPA: hypothetical protein VJP76_01985, partial [Candidatus Tumulicola sp.]|nr:hypothetical protein [Candidatus Tumulicola sp.]